MVLVDISPDLLEYKPPFTEQSTEYATITNNSDQPIAFKVKTTAPKFYCVRPNAAVVAPGESVKVQVILLGLAKEPAEDFKCRDKFLVITLPAPYDLGEKSVAEAWPELEAEFKQKAVSKKIKVKYLLDQREPSQQAVEQAVEKPAQQAQAQEQNNAAVVQESHPEHAPESVQTIDQTKRSVEEEEVSKPVEDTPASEPEKHVKSAPSAASAKTEPVSAQEGALNSTALILIAIIALVLGWLYY
ncbi:hypothetical protein HG536_0B04390 [Torulaspora globosa]|uniref:MSP domain-containing protein n=1 Tax=Torulaspora globosa TaxID=48254 RepID=A0A7G3ZDI9_9SACH|nr:uncharacterized protein HG536_0B04390 [Torulaspora globosa]QLL31575.1 hypothetical protein HG536_0B04390 [Torulaspora globosa]